MIFSLSTTISCQGWRPSNLPRGKPRGFLCLIFMTMREIKFRLIKDGKIVGYEKHRMSCGHITIFHSFKNDDEEGWEWWNVIITPKHFIEHDAKEQFTGLKDKNGKDIYEGDIVDFALLRGSVVFGGIGYSLTRGDHGYILKQADYKDGQVTGNIHENPELLEAK